MKRPDDEPLGDCGECNQPVTMGRPHSRYLWRWWHDPCLEQFLSKKTPDEIKAFREQIALHK